jgi:magnesium-transporting ATPase (P-type)
MKAHETVRWHGLQIAEAVELLDTDLDKGLSENEAKIRLAKYGPNRVTRRPETPAWKRFLLQFHQPLIHMLLLAGAITAGLGEIVDSNRWLLAGVAAMMAAQLAFTYVPFMNAAFHSSPLDADSWLRLIAVAFGVSMIVAFEKRLRVRAEADRGSDDTLEPAVHRV